MMKLTKPIVLLMALGLSACSSSTGDAPSTEATTAAAEAATTEAAAATEEATAEADASDSGEMVTVTNCDEEKEYKVGSTFYVNDGNMIATAMSLNMDTNGSMIAVSSMGDDDHVLNSVFGEDRVSKIHQAVETYPTLESIIASKAEVLYAGWNYGYSEEKGITPDALAERDVKTYTLSEACLKKDAKGIERGTMGPWEAIHADVENLGKITGQEDLAKEINEDTEARLKKLDEAPQAEKKPVIFLFDSATDSIFTSGKFGAPQGIIDKAGAINATEDVEDTWVSVSWEKLSTSKPDAIVFVSYPGGGPTEDKIKALQENPVSKDLDAVKEGRFIDLPYAVWCSSTLNIDGAETLRMKMEELGLLPDSGIKPVHDVSIPIPGQ